MTKEEHAKVLAALEAITKHFSISRLHESTLADTTVRGQAHEAIAIMRKEPEPPTVKESFTVAEQSRELDAGMAAQHYCRGLWGAARGHSDWRKVHEHFANGYKQGCHDNEMAQGPYPWPDDPLDLELRGLLASKLKCWHRLSGPEATELVALFEGLRQKEPEPTDPRHPQYVEGFKAGHAAGRLRGRAEKPPHISDAEIFDIAGNYDCGTNGENMEWTFKSQKELLDFSRALLEKAR